MSRFEQEFALVPTTARWIAVFVALAFATLMAAIFLLPVGLSDPHSLPFVLPVFLASLLGAFFLGVFVLLVGYVFADSKRRGMNHVLWTLLAVFIPNAIGIILYFILRDPVAVPCPSCGALARKGHAYCAGCGTAVRTACPQCRQPVEPGWRNCARCGASLVAPGP
jgi:hypothetical protein